MRLLLLCAIIGALVGLCGCGEDTSWLVVVNNGDGNLLIHWNDPPPDSSAAPLPAADRP